MADKKQKMLRITSPKGIARYPWLQKPDTQFNADGVYKVNLLIPVADCIDLCAQLDVLADESFMDAKAKAKTPAVANLVQKASPYAKFRNEAGEETGLVEFKFKMNARVKMPDGQVKVMNPDFYDRKAKPVGVCPVMYGGSTLKINFSPMPYFTASNKQAGISLRINAVQIIDLVSGPDSHGFDEEEGSFEVGVREHGI
jgi:hypothetical protein